MAAWMVSQEEWQLIRKVRIVVALVVIAAAIVMLLASLPHHGAQIRLADSVAPAVFLGAALFLLAGTPRMCVIGFWAVVMAGTVITYVLGNYTWRRIIVSWMITGFVVLVIILVHGLKRRRVRRA